MATILIDVPLDLVSQVRGVAGQQLRMFEADSGCSCHIVRKGAKAIIEVNGTDAEHCDIAKTLISDFIMQQQQHQQQQLLQSQQSQPVHRPPQQPRPLPASSSRPRFPHTAPLQSQAPNPVRAFPAPLSSQPVHLNRNSTVPSAPRVPTQGPAGHVVSTSLVEVPLSAAAEVQQKLDELSTRTGCKFELTSERNRALVKIEHPHPEARLAGRKLLSEFLDGLAPQPAEDAEPATRKRQVGGSSRNFNFSNCAPTAALPGWESSADRPRDNNNNNIEERRIVLKNFYKEHPAVTSMTDAQVAAFRKQNMEITVKSLGNVGLAQIPKPVSRFEHAFNPFPEILHQLMEKFTTPSPIQCQTWPVLLSGYDLVGIAQTGTGKTLAFLLPALIHIRGQKFPSSRYGGPICLVLSPTRELAIQIFEESCKYAYKGVKCACFYGGASRGNQLAQLRAGPEVIIATPGRLNDLVSSLALSLARVSYLVLDEADRMLDMGFEPQIRQILDCVSSQRQTVMMSATWPATVRRLSSKYTRDPVQVTIGSLDLAAALTVTQRVRMVRSDEKFSLTLSLLRSLKDSDRAIVFCSRKVTADVVASKLNQSGVHAEVIHGDRDQRERESALRHLKTGKSRVLVATDVASRGLDVPQVSVVVNFDFPTSMEEYVHRVGRTGRAGKTGSSYTMMTSADSKFAEGLVGILVKAKQVVPDWLRKMSGNSFRSSAHGR